MLPCFGNFSLNNLGENIKLTDGNAMIPLHVRLLHLD